MRFYIAKKSKTKKYDNELQRIREEKNLTKYKLSSFSGVSESTIKLIEEGGRTKEPTALKLCIALNYSIYDLFDEVEISPDKHSQDVKKWREKKKEEDPDYFRIKRKECYSRRKKEVGTVGLYEWVKKYGFSDFNEYNSYLSWCRIRKINSNVKSPDFNKYFFLYRKDKKEGPKNTNKYINTEQFKNDKEYIKKTHRYNSFSKIRFLRIKKGYSIKDIEKMTQLSANTIYYLEREPYFKNRFSKKREYALKLCKALDCNIDDYFTVKSDTHTVEKKQKEVNLATEYPELIKEWYFSKNKIEPTAFSPRSRCYVWWKCKDGHEWQASIYNRTKGKTKCPYCSKTKDKKLDEARIAKYSELLEEWNYEKNEKSPDEFSPGSSKKVWWKCEKGHEWEAVIRSRTKFGVSCPYCANRKILTGYNDFATKHPELLKEWNYKKNKIDPTKIFSGSKMLAWWKCSKCGNEWQSMIYNRTCKNTGCPACSKKGPRRK